MMPLIVADTGPINYLIQIGCLSVLPRLVGTVILPQETARELRSSDAPPDVRTWADSLPAWVEVDGSTHPIPPSTELSLADRSAIAIASKLQALLLMDDRRARKAATDLGVRTIGTLGILEAAAAKNLISLHDALTRLRSTNIYISEALIAQALDRHAQRDRT